jgi:hypothetical protein
MGFSQALPKCYGATGAAPLGGIACGGGGVVVSAAAGLRQALRSKTTNPIAKAHHTAVMSHTVLCGCVPPTNPPARYMLKTPWPACATMVMSTLPPVWLKSHV